MDEPIISAGYDKDEDGTFFVAVRISGLKTEQKAIAALHFVEKQFCGEQLPVN